LSSANMSHISESMFTGTLETQNVKNTILNAKGFTPLLLTKQYNLQTGTNKFLLDLLGSQVVQGIGAYNSTIRLHTSF
jgi:hypothetical protein